MSKKTVHTKQYSRLISAIALKRVSVSCLVFFLFVCCNKVCAQFVKIEIDIPAQTSISSFESNQSVYLPDIKTIKQDIEGSYTLTLSSAENMQIIAKLTHSEELLNAYGSAINMTATLAYRNDGKNKPPKPNPTDTAIFPMSNSGLLISNMKGSPQTLNAYIVIFTTIKQPETGRGTYYGDINLTIEYN